MILAGDVGGTKCSLGLFAKNGPTLRSVFQRRLQTRDYAGFEDLIGDFLEQAAGVNKNAGSREIEAAGFGLAGTTPIKVTMTAIDGFSEVIALSVSGLPKGVTAAYLPTSIAAPGNGNSTMTLKVASGAGSNTGASTLTVTGKGGGVRQTQKLTLTVTH